MINKQNKCDIRSIKAVLVMAVMLFAIVGQSFAIKGVVVKKNNERVKGEIRWQQSQKQYLVDVNGITMTFKPAQVKGVIVAKPDNFDKAIADVAGKRYASALPVLEKIMTDYKMMGWDVKAARYAAEAQLGMKKPGQAILTCEKLIRSNPDAAYEGALAEIYWQALVEGDRKATFRKVMKKAIKEGPRSLAPLVQIRRADMDMKEEKYKEALVDGYLRTVHFYKNEKKYLPEALYKAAKCFDQLNEPTNAEKMRKILLTDFPDSEYSKKVTIGS